MMQSIYIETLESPSPAARDIVMLHGWGMHGGLMRGLAEKLSSNFNVHLVDLPGHGLSQVNGDADYSLQHLTEEVFFALQNKINKKAIWIGWSLGGLVAISIADHYPAKVVKLVLLSSTPAFVKKHDWHTAVDVSVFETFANDLLHDCSATIKRFLSLQVRGSEDSRETLKQLREILSSKQPATEQALLQGLEILQTEDLRNKFKTLSMPVQLLGGEKDTLVPKEALQELHHLSPATDLHIINKASHAPFLSHLDETASAIAGFCHD